MRLSPRRRLLAVGLLATTAITLTTAATGSSLAAPGGNDTSDAARGKVYHGLAKADAAHCKGRGFYVTEQPSVCTHGPDLAPVGTDVRKKRSSTELKLAGGRARLLAGGPADLAGATLGTAVPPTDGTGAIVCEGDGVSGPRTQVLYVRASDVPSRFAALKDTFGSYMLAMDGKLNASAQETGGSRHVRFVTEPSTTGACQLSVREVVVSPTGDDSFGSTITEVRNAGWDASRIGHPRRFLMLVDANLLCGIGQVYGDDQPGQSNTNNAVLGMYSRSDNGCWNYAEAHELMHNLGGVQHSAPNSTGGYHCNDEYDIECYDDGGTRSTMTYVCSSSHEQRFDCGHDDYFHTDPPSGSYLATHWNTANSRFLINPGTTITTTTPTPTADTTPPSVPTGVTATASGSTVTVRWTLGTEADLAGYRVHRNGSLVGSTGKVGSFAQTVAAGTWSYSVAAVDAAGNASAQSAAASVTVAATKKLRREKLTGRFTSTGRAAITRAVASGPTTGVAITYVWVDGDPVRKPVALRLTNATGRVLASRYSPTAAAVSWTAPAPNRLTWVVVGRPGARWTAVVTYYA